MTLTTKENLTTNMQCSYQTYNRRTGVWLAPVSQGPSLSLRRWHFADSVNTPNFKKLKKRYLPVNYYNKHVEILSDPLATWSADIDGYPVTPTSSQNTNYYVGNGGSLGVVIDQIASAEDPSQRALSSLLSAIAEGKTNTMVSAAEMHKTAHHVAKTATRIYNAWKALKRGDFIDFTNSLGVTSTEYGRRRFNKRYNRAKSFDAQEHRYSSSSYSTQRQRTHMSSFAAQTWLEYKYGWRPLLKDVYDHAKALADLAVERQNVTRFVKARAKTTGKLIRKQIIGSGLVDVDRVQTDNRWVEYGVGFRIHGGGDLNAFSQLGIDNPMEVAWEIIPFSFVADWFLPVGKFLSHLTATSGLVFVNGYKAIRNVSTEEIIYKGNGTTTVIGGLRYGPVIGGGTMSRFRMDQVRVKLDAFPAPQFPNFRDPRDGKDGGIENALSAIALLQSLFLSGRSNASKGF